jgi:Tfp pilus assembly protein PilF
VTAASLYLIGGVHLERGELGEAKTRFAAALTAWEVGLGPDVPEVADALVGLGEVALRQGNPGEAVPRFERAVRIRRLRPGTGGPKLAMALFGLARALQDGRGRDPGRARTLAQEAAELLRTAGPNHQDERATVESWLDR